MTPLATAILAAVLLLASGVVIPATIAAILARHAWISWLGLAVILYVALDMIWDGSREVACWHMRGAAQCAEGLIPLVRAFLAGS